MVVRTLGILVALASCATQHDGRAFQRDLSLHVHEIRSDAEQEAALRELQEMDVRDARRPSLRIAAQQYLFSNMRRELSFGRRPEAFALFSKALTVFEPQDLEVGRATQNYESVRDAARQIHSAYAAEGAEDVMATALSVEVTFAPTRERAHAAEDAAREMLSWIEEVEVLEKGPLARSARVIELLEQVAARFPAPWVREMLTARYLESHSIFGRALRHGIAGEELRAMVGNNEAVLRLAYRLARLHLRADDVEMARHHVDRIVGQIGDDSALRQALDRSARSGASAGDIVALAGFFGQADGDVAERLCMLAARRNPKSAAAWACAAHFAGARQDPQLAVVRYERAIARDPRRQWVDALAAQRLAWLAQLTAQEKLEDATAELGRIEMLHQETLRRWPNEPLAPPVERAVYGLGRGFYWSGDLSRAEPLLKRAFESGQAPDAIEPLANIQANHAEDALTAAQAYEQWLKRAPAPWNAKLLRRRGDALQRAGRMGDATDAWKAALAMWTAMLLGAAPAKGEQANAIVSEMEFELGRLCYLLGQREEALRAIDRAIEVDSERVSTYVDAVAMLATRGDFDGAVDIYLQALGIEGLDDYSKIYISAWVWDLGRRMGREMPVAGRYLEAVEGAAWHYELARFVSGRVSYQEAMGRAKTRGQRAEVQFYEAQNRWAHGRLGEARAMWREVIDSDMLAFYEYEMATFYLSQTAGAQVATANTSFHSP